MINKLCPSIILTQGVGLYGSKNNAPLYSSHSVLAFRGYFDRLWLGK